jgi:PAS domain S-box-containing protein
MHFNYIINILLVFYFIIAPASLSAVYAGKPIYVIGVDDNPPFEFINNEGTQVGFTLDIFRRIASEQNFKYEIELFKYDRFFKSVSDKKADIILGVIPQTVEGYISSRELFVLNLRLSALKSSNINNIEDLENKKIIFTGSRMLYEIFYSNFAERYNMHIFYYENNEYAVHRVYSGTYDAMIDVMLNGLSSISSSETRGLVTVPISWGEFKYTLAVKKDNPELLNKINDAIELIHESGFYKRTFKKWFPLAVYDNLAGKINLYVFAAAAGFFLFVIFFMLNNAVLNRRIKDRTEKLDRSLSRLDAARTRLQDSENKFKTIFEKSPAGLIMVDPTGRVLLYNSTLVEIFGVVNPDQLYSINLNSLAGLSEQFYEKIKVHKNIKHEIEYDFDKAVETGAYKTTRRGKAFFEVIVQKVRMDANPDDIKYLCQIKDVTENKTLMDEIRRSSEQYRLTFEAINDGLWDWDIKSGNVYFNRRFFSILGYIKEIFPQNLNTWIGLIHPEDRDVINQTILNKIKQDMAFVVEYRMRKKDGSWLWVEWRGQTIEWDSDGNPARVIGTHTDISGRKEIEFKLIREKEKALRKEELKTVFLKNVSHEIRTPLNAIIGFSRMLAMENINPETRSMYSGLIDANSDQIMNILSDIVDYSSIEKGEIVFIKKEFSCNELMYEIFDYFSVKAEKTIRNNVKLVCRNLTDEKDFIFSSDRERIKQVMVNLLSNSFRFTSRGTVEFGYNTDSREIVFFVFDQGLRISDEEAENFFDRFASDPTRGRSRDIGISIAGDIIEAMGGELTIDLNSSEGVYFKFKFPVTAVTADSSATDNEVGAYKVLIADDNYLIYFHLSEFLKIAGIQSVYAQDGYEAIEVIKMKNDIDAVLMDMQMPGIDGITALKEIKKIRNIPVIIQTGHVRKDQIQKYFESGCDDVVEKPIDEDRLINKLAELLKRRK